MIEIIQDNDDAGKKGAVKIAKALYDEFGGEPMIAKWDESLPKGFDPRDDDESLTETKKALKNATPYKPEPETSNRKGYNLTPITEALRLDIQKPAMIIEDILNERGNTLLTATDNVGK